MSAARTETLVDAAAAAAATARGPRLWSQLLRHPGVLFGGVILVVMLAIAVLAPVLGTTNPATIDPTHRNQLPGSEWTLRDASGERDPVGRLDGHRHPRAATCTAG